MSDFEPTFRNASFYAAGDKFVNKSTTAGVLFSQERVLMIAPAVPAEPTAREFDEIFSSYCDLVYGTAFGITGTREDAEDVVQTVFLRLLRRELPADIRKNLKAYLYRAAVNESLNIIRHRRRHPTTELEGTESSGDGVESIRAKVIHRILYEAISRLKPKHAEILILRHVHEYSDAEIAQLLGVSRGTIAVTLHRTRAQLKRMLRKTLGGIG